MLTPLGCASDPRRTPQARHCDQPSDRGQVHGAKTEGAFAEPAELPAQSNHADGIAAIDMFVVASVSFRLLYGSQPPTQARHERQHKNAGGPALSAELAA